MIQAHQAIQAENGAYGRTSRLFCNTALMSLVEPGAIIEIGVGHGDTTKRLLPLVADKHPYLAIDPLDGWDGISQRDSTYTYDRFEALLVHPRLRLLRVRSDAPEAREARAQLAPVMLAFIDGELASLQNDLDLCAGAALICVDDYARTGHLNVPGYSNISHGFETYLLRKDLCD